MTSIYSKLIGLISVLFALTFFCPGQVLGRAGDIDKSGANAAQSVNATPVETGSPAAAAQDETRMRIGPGDLLDVNVFDMPELTQAVRVNDLGNASFNLIGRLHVAGLTTDEARDLIARKLKEGNYVLEPQVGVLIREYNTQGVSVLGEVKRPGVYSVLGKQSLLDVIASAGGTTPSAGPEITIKRYADGSTLAVRLSRDAHASLSSDVQLYPGDKVVIPRAGVVYVIGDVGRPGGYIMGNDGTLTLLQALAMAGGSNHTASLGRSRLIRKTPSGISDIHIELKKVMKGGDVDPPLQSEDILYIPPNAIKSLLSRSAPSIISATSGAVVYHNMP